MKSSFYTFQHCTYLKEIFLLVSGVEWGMEKSKCLMLLTGRWKRLLSKRKALLYVMFLKLFFGDILKYTYKLSFNCISLSLYTKLCGLCLSLWQKNKFRQTDHRYRERNLQSYFCQSSQLLLHVIKTCVIIPFKMYFRHVWLLWVIHRCGQVLTGSSS